MEPLVLCSDRHSGDPEDPTSLWLDDALDTLNDETPEEEALDAGTPWRLRERMKTTSVALALCLNIGTDPPDVVKISMCARNECWINPFAQSRHKSLEAIGNALQAQYTTLQSRAIYRQLLDPTADELHKCCQHLRKRAKRDRVLFHYNGHGVPRPTDKGEIWLFNKSYTQYIPLAIQDLRGSVVGSPAVYVFDCSGAGQVLPHFALPPPPGFFGDDEPGTPGTPGGGFRGDYSPTSPRGPPPGFSQAQGGAGGRPFGGPPSAGALSRQESLESPGRASSSYSSNGAAAATGGGGGGGAGVASFAAEASLHADIVLVPCGAHELLPMEPQYPADLFTTCLTTPIPMALRWFVMEHGHGSMEGVDPDLAHHIPGKLNDRKTPLGELNWIFTAVTDSIAWNLLPRALFHRLFRQDLLVASLFRNFLLADRLLRSLSCTPASIPALPQGVHLHALWQAWDLAAECALSHLAAKRLPPPMPPPNGGSGSGGSLNSSGFMQQGALPSQQQQLQSGGGSSNAPPLSFAAGGGGGYPAMSASGGAGATNGVGMMAAATTSSPPVLFFAEQLTAFEVWLDAPEPLTSDNCPEQLPVVLQVLLSQAHRLRALQLLRRFFERGPLAVHLALSVGIFPYVLKLLQSPAADLRQVLVGIWAKVLALDKSCQVDLIGTDAHRTFISHLSEGPLSWEGSSGSNNSSSSGSGSSGSNNNPSPLELHTNAAFVLASMCENYPLGQARCLEQRLHLTLTQLLHTTSPPAPPPARVVLPPPGMGGANNSGGKNQRSNSYRSSTGSGGVGNGTRRIVGTGSGREDSSDSSPSSPTPPGSPPESDLELGGTGLCSTHALAPPAPLLLLLRRWLCLAFGALCKNNPNAQASALVDQCHLVLMQCLKDPTPEVRAAAVYALSCLLTPATAEYLRAGNEVLPSSVSGSSDGSSIESVATTISATTIDGHSQSSGEAWSGSVPLHNHHSPPPPPPSPSLQHLQQRLESDLSVAGALANLVLHRAAPEASPLVRREVMLALGLLVECPIHHASMQAFSSSGSSSFSSFRDVTMSTASSYQRSSQHGHGKVWLEHSSQSNSSSPVRPSVLILKGAWAEATYERIWHAIGILAHDSFQPVASVANDLGRVLQGISSTSASRAGAGAAITTDGAAASAGARIRRIRARRGIFAWSVKQFSAGEASTAAATVAPISNSSSSASTQSTPTVGITSGMPPNSPQAKRSSNSSASGGPVAGGTGASSDSTSSSNSNDSSGSSSDLGLDPLSEEGARALHWKLRVAKGEADAATLAKDSVTALAAFREAAERMVTAPPEPATPLATFLTRPSRLFRLGGGNAHIGSGDAEAPSASADVPVAPRCVAMDQTSVLENDAEMTSILLFHPYEPLLAVADDQDGLSLWAYEEGERWWRLRNGNPLGTRLTSLQWINGDSVSRLAVGSDDGVVRVWSGVLEDGTYGGGGCGPKLGASSSSPKSRGGYSNDDYGENYDGNDGDTSAGENDSDGSDEGRSSSEWEPPRLLTSFAAAPEVAPGAAGAGLVTAYSETLLFAGGQLSRLRLWDLQAEKCVAQWRADPRSDVTQEPDSLTCNAVTALSCAAPPLASSVAANSFTESPAGLYGGRSGESPALGPSVVLTGYGDGAVRLFDARLPPDRNAVASWHEHQAWVVNTHLSGHYGAVSASADGSIDFFDLRASGAVRTLDTLAGQSSTAMTAAAVHSAAPLLAVGSHAQFIKVLTLDGYVLKWIKYHDGFSGQRIGPVSCLAFHPTRAVMAAGATDSIISVYSNGT